MRRCAGALMAAGMLAAGCQTIQRPPFSHEELRRAGSDIRLDTSSAEDTDRYLSAFRQAAIAPGDGAFDVLALSSGGANGAFGAGVLAGWSERGDRPTFEVVTGVSIGALMAPFAFVGRERDADLRAMFTDGRTAHLLQARGLGALIQPGLYRTEPLRDLVTRALDDRLVREIAEGHLQGRRLYVATTSLDTREQVLWDLGSLAASGAPDARERMAEILTAAASVPVAFAPVLIDLDDGGRLVREPHVDGRLTANFFIGPEAMLAELRPALSQEASKPPGRVWILINGSPRTRFNPDPYSGVSVIGRSLEALLNASTRTSLIATAQFARVNGLEFFVTTAGEAGEDGPLDFDRQRMAALFETGRSLGLSGAAWTGQDESAVPPRAAPASQPGGARG